MSKFRAWLWSTIMLVSLFAFASVVYAADGGAVDPSTNTDDATKQFWSAVVHKQWGLAAVIGTMLFVAFMRFIAPKIHGRFGDWIQQSRVSAALAFLGGALSALSVKLLSGMPWSTNLIGFGFTAGLGAIGGYNAFWDLLFPNDKKKSDAKLSIPLPPQVRAGMFVPFLFVGVVLLAGCPAHVSPDVKTFGNAYASCMTAKGLTAAPNVAQEAWDDLNNGADSAVIVAQLEALAKKVGTDAVACAVQAWMTPTPGAPAAKNPAGVEAANTYLKNHSSTTARSNRHAALSPPQAPGAWTGALGA